MKQERIELLEQLRTAAASLASYASYAEIIGAIHHNQTGIREGCDKVQEINAKIKHLDENKRFRVKIRRDRGFQVHPRAEPVDGQTYDFTFGWLEEEQASSYFNEKIWMPMDDTYPKDAPAWIAEGDLEEVE